MAEQGETFGLGIDIEREDEVERDEGVFGIVECPAHQIERPIEFGVHQQFLTELVLFGGLEEREADMGGQLIVQRAVGGNRGNGE